jgi:hypothetical protein
MMKSRRSERNVLDPFLGLAIPRNFNKAWLGVTCHVQPARDHTRIERTDIAFGPYFILSLSRALLCEHLLVASVEPAKLERRTLGAEKRYTIENVRFYQLFSFSRKKFFFFDRLLQGLSFIFRTT